MFSLRERRNHEGGEGKRVASWQKVGEKSPPPPPPIFLSLFLPLPPPPPIMPATMQATTSLENR